MTVLLLTELAVILAATAGTVWLKRAGDRSWHRHQLMRVTVRLIADTSRFTAALAAMGPAMGRAVRAASEFEGAMRQVRDVVRPPEPRP